MRKNGFDLDLRSNGRIIADEVRAAGGLPVPPVGAVPPILAAAPQIRFRAPDRQVNDVADPFVYLNLIFVRAVQSETTIAAFARNIVAGYNTSAGIDFSILPGGGVALETLYLSGYSRSGDGGATWTAGFLPALPDSIFTFGDPSMDVDRTGNFYYASLGGDADGNSTIQVNKSVDGGATWMPAVLVQQDDGGDKEWLAVGPDPSLMSRDNLYVTWTSFQPNGAELRLGRSIDGGATWTVKTIFAPGPDPNPLMPQNSFQFTAPVVDRVTGKLYVPFVHFSFADQDFIRILVSADGGENFSLLKFNIQGALLDTVLPFVQPGTITECGVFAIPRPPDPPLLIPNVRLTIHDGPDVGGSLTGLPRYVSATRQIAQPSLAARNGVLYLAWPQSTSPFFGDPGSGSNIMFLRSEDGGASWTSPVRVNDPLLDVQRSFMPALTVGASAASVHVLFYGQAEGGTIQAFVANSIDRGASFPLSRTAQASSAPTVLGPTNIPAPSTDNPWATRNFDALITTCYFLGEYNGITQRNGATYVVWGDGRNTMTQPESPFNPLSGLTHPQPDVFFRSLQAQ